MNIKKTALLLASVSVLATGVVLADHHGERHGRDGGRGMSGGFPMMMVDRMTRHLDLDETQEVGLKNILDAAKPEFDVLRERGQSNRKALFDLDPAAGDYSASLNNLALESGQIVTDAALLMGRVRAEINAILTPEQAAELKARIEKFGEGRRGRRGDRRGREEGAE